MILSFFKNNKQSLDESSTGNKNLPNWLKKLPNRLTFLRIMCIPVVVYLMSLGEVASESGHFGIINPIKNPSMTDIAAAIVFAVAAITDFFDGWIARKFNVETVLGKLLDPLADKLLVVSAMVILVEKHRMDGLIAVIIIVRDLGINAIRLAAIEDGIQIPSSFIGKTKTTFQDLGIIGLTICGTLWFIPFHYIGQFFIMLALAASLISGIQYLYDYAKQLKN
ncbi:CDP-diacylglycerol--glycerol-3-phosphate 3-phosphatidyltransferase [Silvanigrella paludirubra]|uniref:CDP-diacylglycerol--glycerol-3-phosphate 3-phosphatidyltransferase n=1 Tax=Silvanigrella paludirubra TaxID=2499159 RepID=A0A6N6VTB2_9BACT|nr:CDP-diacylglycerol--glycerol-3-phosphate 3-phosphatidyltransferase [Silvanigrella paludirubra]KAB8039220.1 CDP-diacylglycerol--glycerol-3-phosphate 3-phosphatidyltransferase [Silvanigrella paludirubra]